MEKITKGYHVLLVALLILLALATQAALPGAVAAKTVQSYNFTVNTQADTHDAHVGDGLCADSKGRCSLRAAIEEADALPKGSSIAIMVPQGTYRLKLGTLQLTANAITITGASKKTTLISGNNTYGIMSIGQKATVSLSEVTLTDGKASSGAGIYTLGMLNMSNSTVSYNRASGIDGTGGGIFVGGGIVNVSNSALIGNRAIQHGGGIANGTYQSPGGTVTVNNSTITGNRGYFDGGGIYNDSGLTISNSTVSGNMASGGGGSDGGGIYNDSGGRLSMSNSNLSGNRITCCDGRGEGGGIFNYGLISISNSTISSNGGGYEGGGIFNSGGTVLVSNSTLSSNGGGDGANIYNDVGLVRLTGAIVANGQFGPNCSGTIREGTGFNLDSGNTCGFSLSNDLNNTDPKLGSLSKNGGPTETIPLLPGSKAIDWITASAMSSCPATDQRGYPRPDNNEDACDIGAYESAY